MCFSCWKSGSCFLYSAEIDNPRPCSGTAQRQLTSELDQLLGSCCISMLDPSTVCHPPSTLPSDHRHRVTRAALQSGQPASRNAKPSWQPPSGLGRAAIRTGVLCTAARFPLSTEGERNASAEHSASTFSKPRASAGAWWRLTSSKHSPLLDASPLSPAGDQSWCMLREGGHIWILDTFGFQLSCRRIILLH
jgi:hypothetical protein